MYVGSHHIQWCGEVGEWKVRSFLTLDGSKLGHSLKGAFV